MSNLQVWYGNVVSDLTCWTTDLNFIGECDSSLKGLHSGSKRAGAKLSPYFVPKILPNLNGGHVSMKFGMQVSQTQRVLGSEGGH